LSVALYVKEANLGIQKKIKKLLDYANAHPYPTGEIADARKNKKKYKGNQLAIAQLLSIYSEEGPLVDDLSTIDDETIRFVKEAAELISPGLWQRLQDSQVGLAKRDEVTNYYNTLDPEKEIREAYQKFYAVLSSSDSKKSQTAKKLLDESPADLFVDKLKMECGLGLALNSFGADGLVQAAFRDMFIEKPAVAKPASTEPVSTKQASSSGTINETKPLVSTQSASNTSIKSEGAINEKTSTVSTSAKPVTSNKSDGAINEKTSVKIEPTVVTSADGSITSKTSELQTENILPANPAQSVNINLENKQPEQAASTSSTNTSSTNTQNITNNSGNILNSKSGKNKTILKQKESVEKTSESSSINTEKKEKGGFLSAVGNLAKKAGSALNLASISELRDAAGGFFGATGANVESRVEEIAKSFKNTSINSQKNINSSSPTTNTNTNNESAVNSQTNNQLLNTSTDLGQTSTSSNVSSENQSNINIEQKKPTVLQVAPSVSSSQSNSSNATDASNVIKTNTNTNTSSNTSNSAVSSNTAPKNTSESKSMDASKTGGTYVDMLQVTQAISRLERTILSGIEVTIKDA
jgi:hypothetical protein